MTSATISRDFASAAACSSSVSDSGQGSTPRAWSLTSHSLRCSSRLALAAESRTARRAAARSRGRRSFGGGLQPRAWLRLLLPFLRPGRLVRTRAPESAGRLAGENVQKASASCLQCTRSNAKLAKDVVGVDGLGDFASIELSQEPPAEPGAGGAVGLVCSAAQAWPG